MGKRGFVVIGSFVFVLLFASSGCVTADYVGEGSQGKETGGRETEDGDSTSASSDGDDSVSTSEDDTSVPTSDSGGGDTDDDKPDSQTGEPQETVDDEDTGSDDPFCGAVGQACCVAEVPCDEQSMVCVTGYPEENDAFCWRTCEVEGCSTTEPGQAGYCYPTASTNLTYCAPATGEMPSDICSGTVTCPGTSECLVASDQLTGYCFETGCDPISTCTNGRWCAPLQNGSGACVD